MKSRLNISPLFCCMVYLFKIFKTRPICLLGDLEEKFFKIAQWPKRFFLKPTKTITVPTQEVVAVFSPVNQL